MAEYYQPFNRPKRCRNWQYHLNGPLSCDNACRKMARDMPISGLKQVNKLSNTTYLIFFHYISVYIAIQGQNVFKRKIMYHTERPKYHR